MSGRGHAWQVVAAGGSVHDNLGCVRQKTAAKETGNGLPNTIARMQQTLTNLRSCANKMKESGRSSVKQRMELSERAMHAYRELKELTTV